MTVRSPLASVCVLAALLAAPTARADDPPPTPTPSPSPSADDHVSRARDFHAKGDFLHARDELLAAYQIDPRPALLFALGQVELNLGHYKQAIDYYERFKQTNPPPDQAALAEQAIGAARLELQRPPPQPPKPPPPPPHREWDGYDAAIAVTGTAALVASGALFYESSHLAQQRGGSLAAYSGRIDRAHVARDAAIGCAAGGVLAFGAAVLRWRLHLVDTEISVEASPTSAAVSLGRRL